MIKLLSFRNFFLPAIFIAVFYLILSIYSINFSLVKETIFSQFPINYKIGLLFDLLGGFSTNSTNFGRSILILTAVLVGANLTLLIRRYKFIRSSGGMHLIVGGGSLLSIAGSGCTSCGLPILGLLGLSGTMSGLPFKGLELSILSLGLLLISFIILIRNSYQQVCSL